MIDPYTLSHRGDQSAKKDQTSTTIGLKKDKSYWEAIKLILLKPRFDYCKNTL